MTGNTHVAYPDINPAEFHLANPGNCLNNRGHLSGETGHSGAEVDDMGVTRGANGFRLAAGSFGGFIRAGRLQPALRPEIRCGFPRAACTVAAR